MKRGFLNFLLATMAVLSVLLFSSCRNSTEKEGSEKVTSNNKIEVTSPSPHSTITSPLTIKGKARGSWFFEASAPVQLVNQKNEVIAESYIQANEDWMTEDFVPFSGSLKFPDSNTKSGFLILKKSNPSGLPEQSDEVKIPVNLK